MSVDRGGRTWLKHNLLFIPGPYKLKDLAQIRIIVDWQYDDVDVERAAYLDRTCVLFRFHRIHNRFRVYLAWLRFIGYLPAQRELDLDFIGSLKRKLKVNRMHALGVIE